MHELGFAPFRRSGPRGLVRRRAPADDMHIWYVLLNLVVTFYLNHILEFNKMINKKNWSSIVAGFLEHNFWNEKFFFYVIPIDVVNQENTI